jgi:HKD family nuclease
MSLHVQPDGRRFFEILSSHLEQGGWTDFEAAVAWARENAVASLTPVLRQFLQAGGHVRITVGVGLQGTTQEALEALVDLESFGDIAVFVYHNEAPEETFHPKVYLFKSSDRARLIVGSNNLTDGGLASNIEASLEVHSEVDAAVITEARRVLESLRDTSDRHQRIRRLDRALVPQLVAGGYVIPEADLRTRRAASTREHRLRGRTRTRLFGRLSRARLGQVRRTAAQVVETSVLLLRPRRASETERRTQVQIPIRLTRTPFFAGITTVISAHDNRTHGLRAARARGGVNTVKLELPEIDRIDEPVLRVTRRGNRVTYEAFSADSDLGRPINDALLAGLDESPAATVATVADRRRATLYRFV